MVTPIGAVLMVGGSFGFAIMPARARTLSFDERVATQQAIEQVYWNHRIWPKANSGPKPSLAAVMPDEAIRAKVVDYLRKSNALERWWQRPVTGEQLHAELNRMAISTRDGRTLQELYRALGDDAFVIAETLARQTLVDRLVRDWYSGDSRFHAGLRSRAEAALSGCSNVDCMKTMGGAYRESTWTLRSENVDATDLRNALQADEWAEKLEGLATQFGTGQDSLPIGRLSGLQETAEGFVATSVLVQTKRELVTASVTWPKRPFDAWWAAERGGMGAAIEPAYWTFTTTALPATTCANDSWSPTGIAVPDQRTDHTAVWTGAEMIVWGGSVALGQFNNTGGRYNPATDTWSATSTGAIVPIARARHTAVWTGTEMIVWGGSNESSPLNTGGRYNPSTDAWTATSVGLNLPAPRIQHTAVWTGTEMIVWGGYTGSSSLDTGGRYNPSTDGWVATSTSANVPTARRDHATVWTGSRMVVWGGVTGPPQGPLTHFNSGGRYDPTTDGWTATSTGAGVPNERSAPSAVWTGTEMIVWGGVGVVLGALNSGGRYNPTSDTWTASSTGANVPAARSKHAAVWTGTEMVVWGGHTNSVSSYPASGGRYDPSTNTWRTMSPGPAGRASPTGIWTGTEMIVFGGFQTNVSVNTGGRYNPSSDSWVATPTGANVPGARFGHTAVWTGAEMIVWGAGNTGGRYNPATDSWTPTSTGANVPTLRSLNTAVWTGTEMIIWGGYGSSQLNTGGRYNPLTDTWLPTSTASAPAARSDHTAVWTGTEMIVWGGDELQCECALDTGGRYNPSTNTWRPTSTGAFTPTGRLLHTAVWTGTEMIVWGGTDYGVDFKTGGRYNPISDSWVTTRTGSTVPSARSYHTAVWTGAEMIVWGGLENTGGRYNPATDSWTPTSTGANVPTPRYLNTGVWTGTEMIVWGGSSGSSDLNTGGRYNPGTAVWTPTSTAGASVPSDRSQHTAVWTGTEMIVWGGYPMTATGGRYCACPGGRIVYLDADGDGYGNAAISMPSCDGSIPTGYAADTGDCDDAHASTHPGATEACNGVDDDCDAIVDNGGVILCNDNNVCTDDVCQGLTGCAHAFNTAPCDDGNPCTYFDTCSAGTCSSGPPGPPPEIGGVSVTGHGPTTLNWTGLGGGASYDLATSTIEELRANATTTAACLADDIPVTSYVDAQPDPAENTGYYYLVRASNTCGIGGYGFDSAGAERIPTAACP